VVSGAFRNPERIIFPDIEPPDVQVRVVQKPGKNTDLILGISIKPRSADAKQKINRVILWRDDYRFPKPPQVNKLGVVDEPKFVIPRDQLRRGPNQITVQCYNEQGGRGQVTVPVTFDDGTKAVRNLHALCVGINNYSAVQGWEFEDLNFARPDAEEMDRVFRQQNNSGLFIKADVGNRSWTRRRRRRPLPNVSRRSRRRARTTGSSFSCPDTVMP